MPIREDILCAIRDKIPFADIPKTIGRHPTEIGNYLFGITTGWSGILVRDELIERAGKYPALTSQGQAMVKDWSLTPVSYRAVKNEEVIRNELGRRRGRPKGGGSGNRVKADR